MATNVTQSLFGMTPQSIQAQREADLQAQALRFAQLTPMQQAQMGLFTAGSRLGTGLASALGYEDPEMVQAKARQGLLGGLDMSDPESLLSAARSIQRTDPEAAQMLVMQANELAGKQAQTVRANIEAEQKQAAAAREEQLRQELASLPSDAADKDVEAVVRKYGNPDQLFKALERRQTAEANRQSKAELEREKAERAEAARQERMQFQQTMAMLAAQQRQATNELQRERIQQQIDATREKQQEASDKKQMALDMSVRHANKMLTDVGQAKELVSSLTTGIPGKAAALVPGTDAFNLNQRVLTLKANLGFDRLQQMREASPTGGALGQVAVQELEALQASVGSLEVGQSKSELLKNLNKIDEHYKAWLNAVQGVRGQPAQGVSPAPSPTLVPTMRFNPATGRLEQIRN